MTGRILYESVDVPSPSGGIRRLYRHVEILNKYGLRASILHHRRGFKLGWFATNAPVEYWDAGFTLQASDILVIPEGHTDVIKSTANAGCQRIVIALNWANIYARLPIGKDWRDYGIRHVIAGSDYERQFIRQSMGLDSTVLASGTNGDLFRPAERKKLQIAYMPRKNAEVFHVIACVFRSGFRSGATCRSCPSTACRTMTSRVSCPSRRCSSRRAFPKALRVLPRGDVRANAWSWASPVAAPSNTWSTA
jgi:hypothetical protein